MRRRNTATQILLPLIIIAVAWGASCQPAQAIWHNLLMENFTGSAISWYNQNGWGNWDIYPAYPPGPPYSWGITSYIFYNNGIGTQSLWCVGAPNTLDPEQDPYPPNTNSWVKWGPINLSTAVAARASFWYYCESQQFGDFFYWGAWPANQFNMYESHHFSGITNDWVYGYVDFDSLEGGTVSLLGQSSVFLEFHFLANGDASVDMGAFIDVVSIAWDDGILDLQALAAFAANPDSSEAPYVFEGDSIRFRFYWLAAGSGTTPMFDIGCWLDGERFYTERRNVEIGGAAQVAVNTYSDTWVAVPDTHTVVWMLDVRDEIPEYSEDNNDTSMTLVPMPPNSPPWIQILRPTWGDTAATQFWIVWEDEDPDDDALINIYWDNDSTGYNGVPIGFNISEDDETDSLLWDVTELMEGPIWVFAYIGDGFSSMYDYSDGPLIIDHLWPHCAEPGFPGLPEEMTLESVFPNPFNSSTTVRLGLPKEETIAVKVFDSAGRLCARPFEGWLPAGHHQVTWSPGDLPSGIYLIELAGPDARLRTKAVYLK